MTNLNTKTCEPCAAETKPLDEQQAETLLKELNDWQINESATQITKTFEFKNFYRTMAFVNAVAWIANKENHHPDLQVSYNRCAISFETHAINGLSENDFICAAKIDAL